MHKALHPRDDKDRLHVPIKEERKELTRTEDCEDTSIQVLEDNIKRNKERLITATN